MSNLEIKREKRKEIKKTGEISEKNKDTKQKVNGTKNYWFKRLTDKLLEALPQKKKKKYKLVALLIKTEQN